MKTIITLLAVAVVAGCASPSKVATAEISFMLGTNKVTVSNPKDVSFDSLTVNPATGEISVRKYRSSANEAAIAASQAQAEAQAATLSHALDLVAEAAAKTKNQR